MSRLPFLNCRGDAGGKEGPWRTGKNRRVQRRSLRKSPMCRQWRLPQRESCRERGMPRRVRRRGEKCPPEGPRRHRGSPGGRARRQWRLPAEGKLPGERDAAQGAAPGGEVPAGGAAPARASRGRAAAGAQEDGAQRLARLRRKARALPLLPGVYFMKNAERENHLCGQGQGAAKPGVELFCGRWRATRPRWPQMVAQVDDFDTIITANELEALVLECSHNQAVHAPLQHPAQGRQELSLHQGDGRGALPARDAHPPSRGWTTAASISGPYQLVHVSGTW